MRHECCSRPDLAFSVDLLPTKTAAPTQSWVSWVHPLTKLSLHLGTSRQKFYLA